MKHSKMPLSDTARVNGCPSSISLDDCEKVETMDTQRLRNLTTGRLHTDISHVYQDLEFLTGMEGLMTHMLPNVLKAVAPWLKESVTEKRYWDGEYDPEHTGECEITPMNIEEQERVKQRYLELPHPFAGK